MKLKKLISFGLVTAMGLALFAGCNGQDVIESVTDTSSGTTAGRETAAVSDAAAEGTQGNEDDGLAVDADLSASLDIQKLSDKQTGAYRDGYVDFSFKLINGCIDSDGHDANIMVSPASVMLALDMTAAGAKGLTLGEMVDLFGGVKDPSAQISYAAMLMSRLNNAEGVKLNAANSVWINNTVMPEGISKEYYDFIHGKFAAEADALIFNEEAKNRINDWVKKKTNNMIPGVVDELDPDMAMMLINAICFEGKWAEQYKDGQVIPEDFTAADGSTNKVNMMNGISKIYLENDLATGFIKEYEGGQYAFVVMLPKDKKQDAGTLLASFDGKTFDEYMKSATDEYTVNTKMPEFSYDWSRSIVPQLKALGMNTAFSPAADFSGMTDGPYNDLYIGNVLHKTHIEVDRNGTKAAAVTAVMMYKNMVMIDENKEKDVFCDRPFAYAIVDTTDNTPIFIGTVNQVKAD